MNKYLYRATCVESFFRDSDASGSAPILEDLDNELLFLCLPNDNHNCVYIFKYINKLNRIQKYKLKNNGR
jgi:hypothetical protein